MNYYKEIAEMKEVNLLELDFVTMIVLTFQFLRKVQCTKVWKLIRDIHQRS